MREYWQDMAENDPSEFTCIVGADTLIKWALGRSAGPGSHHVCSLDEWLDLMAENPEGHLASYDGCECEVTHVDDEDEVVAQIGFVPEVAYRQA